MGKKKNNPRRQPIRAKSALPAPKVSPTRTRVVWYRRRGFVAIFVLLALAAIGLGSWQFLRGRARAKQTADEKRAVRQFERSLTLAASDLDKVLAEMNTLPGQLRSGELAAADFKVKTESWLASLRGLDNKVRVRLAPQRLHDAKVSLLQALVLYLDAAKVFTIAADSTDPALRDRAIEGGRNIMAHAESVYLGARLAVARERVRIGLASEEEAATIETQLAPLPEEEAGEEQPPLPPPSG